MIRTITVIATFALCAAEAHAQGTVSITSVNPGPNAGQITASGNWTIGTGWTRGNILLNVWQTGGRGVAQGFTATVKDDGTWTATATGLTSNASYNVGAQMMATMGLDTEIIQSGYTTKTAK